MPSLIACLKYDDAPAAVAFLKAAFGFAEKAVYADPVDSKIIHHAELTLGDSMLMLGSIGHGEDRISTPSDAAVKTMSLYGVIDDADAHCANAKLHGARILREPHDNEGYPGRSYDALDTEGHLWNFGTYNPWA